MMPSPFRALSHHHPAQASGHRTVSASVRSSGRLFGISASGRSARASASSSSSSSFPSSRKTSAAAAMPSFFGRPLFFSRRAGGRGQHVPARATGGEDDAGASSSSPPPPSTLYADLEVVTPGAASPLGPSKVAAAGAGGRGEGVNFALWSSAATSVTLCLLDPRSPRSRPAREVALSRTEADPNVWAATVLGLPLKGVGYAFKVDGPHPAGTRNRWSPGTLLLDPYAPLVDSRSRFGVRDAREAFVPLVGSSFVGTFDFESPEFDWGDDANAPSTKTPPGKHVIYEVGVRPFTAAGWGASEKEKDAEEALRGTFAGLAAKAPYLASLGVTAVELLPIFEYDELEFRRRPNPRDHMTNVWGYSHISFFAPMSRFGGVEVAKEVEKGGVSGGGGSGGGGGGGLIGSLFPSKARNSPADTFGAVASATALELKKAVKELHKHGISVLLDVVYNHTAEGDDVDPYVLSWRGIDGAAYYQLSGPGAASGGGQPEGELLNYSGCGNTVAANSTPARELVLASLRHWCSEYHVDGFRFDLASALTRAKDGTPLPAPPLIEDIARDEILSKKLLISEPWDCGGLYQVGSFPNWGTWGEWNGRFRDDVRRFLRGDPGLKGSFAARIAGSADLYGSPGHNFREPHRNVNFVIAHDGFSLADLVSYSRKRNDANGEGGRDGSDDNFSWNCGHEGPTDDRAVLSLRARQARSLMVALFLSQGTPMIVSGDECLLSHHGNNNWYGHDSAELAHFDWGLAERGGGGGGGGGPDGGFRRFLSGLAELRRTHPALGRTRHLAEQDVTWHEDRWDDAESRFLAFTLHDETGEAGDLYAAFNAHGFPVAAALPPVPAGHKRWRRWVDTNLPSPRDWTPGGNESGVNGGSYEVAPHSAIVLIASKR